MKARDHCHITGKFRGSAHDYCNWKLRIDPDKIKIPVVFHNLRGYDSHFLMQNIGEIVNRNSSTDRNGEVRKKNINAIPNNMEKYMAFMLGNRLNFIDSFQFMSSGLDKLVSNLPDEAFKYTSEVFNNEKFSLMKKKGVYPYDYMDSFKKFKKKKQSFQQKNSFTDYKHAQKVWKSFNLENMGDYHDLYLKSDVLLLADVFENFRKTCIQY